jgi:hypothetical protein
MRFSMEWALAVIIVATSVWLGVASGQLTLHNSKSTLGTIRNAAAKLNTADDVDQAIRILRARRLELTDWIPGGAENKTELPMCAWEQPVIEGQCVDSCITCTVLWFF